MTTAEEFAHDVVSRLRDAGYVAHFAGGCVRDLLLGMQPQDYDVATSARPQQIRDVFGKRRTLAIGESFGVISVLGPKPLQVEVATFRSDGPYSDGRRPDRIAFSSPEEDAARRDFTINGMFYDPVTREVIDFVGGQADLKSKIIRAIGDPYQRIEEDRLRMLRAVRFACTYGLTIEARTFEAIQTQCREISPVSQERITAELTRFLQHPNRSQGLSLLHESGLLAQLLPAVSRIREDGDRWNRLLKIMTTLGDAQLPTVLAALFGAEGAGFDGRLAAEECRRLKLSNAVRKSVEWILANQNTLQTATAVKFSVLQPLLVQPDVEQALSLLEVVASVDGTSQAAVALCREKLRLPLSSLNPAPLVVGADLIAMQLPPGPEFSKLLRFARTAQLDGVVQTRAEALELIQKHKSRE